MKSTGPKTSIGQRLTHYQAQWGIQVDTFGSSLKLSEKALKAINYPAILRMLINVFGCTKFTIARYIQHNNKKLTQSASAKMIIREISKLPYNEILVPFTLPRTC